MLLTEINSVIAKELKIGLKQVESTVKLLEDGNTVPFIARYRKEMTGELDEEKIRLISERSEYLHNFVEKQEDILRKIEEQGKLTPELKLAIEKTTKLQELEDIYLPFKQKKSTRAQKAKAKGLEPLANIMLLQKEQKQAPLEIAKQFCDAEKEVNTPEEAIQGAMDIIAEAVSEDVKLRQLLRTLFFTKGFIKTELKCEETEEKAQVYLMYKEHEEPVRNIVPHRVLAINRGEKEDILKVKLGLDKEQALAVIEGRYLRGASVFKDILKAALEDAYKRLLEPAMERELRNQLTEAAEKQAIHIFGVNLKQLLLQPPLAGHTVMGLDPGYRTGCKMAIVDATGNVLDHGVLYITHGDKGASEAAKKALALIKKHKVTLISIGNGTASLETEEFAAKLIRDNGLDVSYIITNEAGASVYSASPLAKEELPEYDVTIRGAVSIARRVQDPLAELVKIEPKAIGVGQYQHDVNQKELTSVLDQTVESAVNHVGVELNTASPALLKHVAGINSTIAKNIVEYRNTNGTFGSRKELMKVARLGNAAFTQCAGFLRIAGSSNPLDNTPVHPESYALAKDILAYLGADEATLKHKENLKLLQEKIKQLNVEKLAQKLKAGVPTVRDILEALAKPGRDPREDMPVPLTRKAIVKLSDIQVGSVMYGTVRNITDFGVFVDIGIKTAGLIHISELSYKRVRHPMDVVAVGDVVKTVVISVDEKRGRIGLSLKQAQ